MEAKVDIIILDFMKAERVLKNLSFLLAQEASFNFKIIVIDNSCDEKNAKILEEGIGKINDGRITLKINEKNVGYVKAHNEAISSTKGEFIAIINPDVLLKEKDSLAKMVSFMENNSDVGVLGPKQVNDNGEIAMSVRAFPKLYLQVARRTFLRKISPIKEKVLHDEMKHLDYSKIQDVDWLQSSCMVIRRDTWDKIGGFNELYFLFMADVEFCFESWKIGKRVVFYPEVRVFADGRRVSEGGVFNFFNNWILRQHVWDAFLYRTKHLFRKNPRNSIKK